MSVLVDVLVKIALDHPDAGVMVAFALYIGYEIRYGKLNDIQEEQSQASKERKIIGVALYKVLKDDPGFDEDQFRNLLWGSDDGEEVFPRDIVRDGGEEVEA